MPTVAVVGCGKWGKNHVRNFCDLGALGWVCDLSIDQLVALPAHGAKMSADVDVVLADRKVEGVVIATPPETHYALALRALGAGKDVLVEKPMTLRPDEASHLVDVANERGRILMVGHILEYHPAVEALLARANYDGAYRVDARRMKLGRVSGENALWTLGPHDIALALRVLGGMPSEVVAWGGIGLGYKYNIVRLRLSWEDRRRANLFLSCLTPEKEAIIHVTTRIGVVRWNESTRSLLSSENGIATEMPFGAGEPLRAECEAFLQAIATRQQPVTSGDSGFRTVQVLTAAQSSLEQRGVPIKIVGN